MARIKTAVEAVLALPREDYVVQHRTAQDVHHSLCEHLGCPIQHESSDYCSEKFIIWFDADNDPVKSYSPNSTTMIDVIISNRGKYYVRFVREGRMRKMWFRVPDVRVPKAIEIMLRKIDVKMTELGYSLLEGDLLQETADGHVTDLDGKPATVFESLFSEID